MAELYVKPGEAPEPFPGRRSRGPSVCGALPSAYRCFQKQVCDDIGRRLSALGDAWARGNLSAPVRRRMVVLVRGEGGGRARSEAARKRPREADAFPIAAELERRRWDAADEIHRSLMVDHVNEVSLWLVGVKRLIAECRNLPASEMEEDGAAAGPGPEVPAPPGAVD
ncbi:UNVERIFIED_CONTAM: hypothetical protein H355_011696 [Colinus virginianus]|nr:hypothetical protein H355_011696 [Colinus virginianus]